MSFLIASDRVSWSQCFIYLSIYCQCFSSEPVYMATRDCADVVASLCPTVEWSFLDVLRWLTNFFIFFSFLPVLPFFFLSRLASSVLTCSLTAFSSCLLWAFVAQIICRQEFALILYISFAPSLSCLIKSHVLCHINSCLSSVPEIANYSPRVDEIQPTVYFCSLWVKITVFAFLEDC